MCKYCKPDNTGDELKFDKTTVYIDGPEKRIVVKVPEGSPLYIPADYCPFCGDPL